MKLDLLLDEAGAADYDYKVSIDSNTYNQIKLYCDNDETKKREMYVVQSAESINKWGMLVMDESIEKGVDGQTVAENYLALYNRPSRALSIKEAFGDLRVRAGCLIPVKLDLKDVDLKNYLVIESAVHKIEEGIHTMDLTLKGANISG